MAVNEQPASGGTYTGAGYVKKHYPVSAAQYAVFVEATHGLNEATKQFFAHCIRSTFVALSSQVHLPLEERGFSQIPSLLRRQEFRGDDWRVLVELGLLEYRTYQVGVKSYSFRVTRQFLDAFLATVPRTPEEVAQPRLNLFTGKVTSRRVRSRINDENNKPYPALIRNSIQALMPCPIDVDAILAHLRKREQQVSDANSDKERRTALRRFYVDRAAWNVVQEQGIYRDAQGRWHYLPAYEPQRYGRIGQIRGGLQGASGEMKHAAYSGIAGLINYDLSAAQPRMLLFIMREHGFESHWLDKYLRYLDLFDDAPIPEPKKLARSAWANAIGLTGKELKSLMIPVLMSAAIPLPDRLPYGRGRVRSIIKNITLERLEARGLLEWTPSGRLTRASMRAYQIARRGIYRSIYLMTRELKADLERWHEHLVTDFLKSFPSKPRRLITNRCGMKLPVELVPQDERWRRELQGHVAAFLLQGAEAAVIHHLTILSKSCGFTPVANEYDGLITIGEVPPSAVVQAAQNAGIPPVYAVLETKPF